MITTAPRFDPFRECLLSIRADLDALVAALSSSIEQRLEKLATEIATSSPEPRPLTEQIEASFVGLPPMAALAHASVIQGVVSTATMKAVASSASTTPAPLDALKHLAPAAVEAPTPVQPDEVKPSPGFSLGRAKAVLVPGPSAPFTTALGAKLTEAEAKVAAGWSVAVEGGRFKDVLDTGVSRQLASNMGKVVRYLGQDEARRLTWAKARVHLDAALAAEKASIATQPVDPEDVDYPGPWEAGDD